MGPWYNFLIHSVSNLLLHARIMKYTRFLLGTTATVAPATDTELATSMKTFQATTAAAATNTSTVITASTKTPVPAKGTLLPLTTYPIQDYGLHDGLF